MKSNDLVELIKSPAVTILIGTLCFILVIRQVKPVIKSLKSPGDC